MGNAIWRWIRKAVILEILMIIVEVFILIIFGVSSLALSLDNLENLGEIFSQNTFIIIIILLLVSLIIKGLLIEKVNDWIK